MQRPTCWRRPARQPSPLVAVGDDVLGALLPALPPNATQPTCKLVDSTTTGFKAQVRALGVVRTGTTDDVLVWDAGGKLLRYPASVFNGCAMRSRSTLVRHDVQARPGIADPVDRRDPRPAPGPQTATSGFLQVIDASGDGPDRRSARRSRSQGCGPPRCSPSGATTYVVAGYPDRAGRRRHGRAGLAVQGIDHRDRGRHRAVGDAATTRSPRPTSRSAAGSRRCRSTASRCSQQVLAVAADNEIFVYFRANLTDGTRAVRRDSPGTVSCCISARRAAARFDEAGFCPFDGTSLVPAAADLRRWFGAMAAQPAGPAGPSSPRRSARGTAGRRLQPERPQRSDAARPSRRTFPLTPSPARALAAVPADR